MKIKNEKQQLREEQVRIERLISWQRIAVRKAQRRYNVKSFWMFIAFWIWDNTDTLRFAYDREEAILNALYEYLESISDRLINCEN